MKPFSGPGGRRPWLRPRKDQLVNVGDSIKLRKGTLTLLSFNEDGSANLVARDSHGEELEFVARREANGEWEERVSANRDTMPESARPYMDKPILGNNPFDGLWGDQKKAMSTSVIMGTHDEMKSWQEGFKAAAQTQNIPLVGEAIFGRREPLIEHLEGQLKDSRQRYAKLQREIGRAKVKHRKMERLSDADYEADVQQVSQTLRGTLKLERPQGSSFHHLVQYVTLLGGDATLAETLSKDFQSMVIEHDWAAAFEGVEGMNDTGEVPMPFDDTCFEFRINGLRMLILMSTFEGGRMEAILCTGVNGHWYTTDERFTFRDGQFVISREIMRMGGKAVEAVGELLGLIGRQIRAVCIMLDAEVAEADEQHPSPALNKARRAAGRSELKPYHVVRIHRQHRHRTGVRGEATGARKRAHVRRGHWRHFTVGTGREQYTDKDGILRSRTWINWMLVGDPAIVGFVDKEYRL